MALVARHRADRARALEGDDAVWQCGRGHAWDDGVSAAQNVRCMNCATQAAYRAIESAGAGARRAVDIGGLRGCRYALALGMRLRACLGCIAGRGDTTLVRGVHASRRVRLGAGSKNLTGATRKLFSNHPE
jgi:hypothetical protein